METLVTLEFDTSQDSDEVRSLIMATSWIRISNWRLLWKTNFFASDGLFLKQPKICEPERGTEGIQDLFAERTSLTNVVDI